MRALFRIVGAIVCVAGWSGCLHSYQSHSYWVYNSETQRPIGGAGAMVTYQKYLDPFAPESSAGETDGKGRVTLEVAGRDVRVARGLARLSVYARDYQSFDGRLARDGGIEGGGESRYVVRLKRHSE